VDLRNFGQDSTKSVAVMSVTSLAEGVKKVLRLHENSSKRSCEKNIGQVAIEEVA
jgi:hypothetical protein